jgi:hypothetical protein
VSRDWYLDLVLTYLANHDDAELAKHDDAESYGSDTALLIKTEKGNETYAGRRRRGVVRLPAPQATTARCSDAELLAAVYVERPRNT